MATSAGAMLVFGSTPIAEKVSLHGTSPSGEFSRWTPQPSCTSPRSDVAHFNDRSGLSAMTYEYSGSTCAAETVKMVPSRPTAGVTFTPGRCAPQMICGGTASADGGQGRGGGGFS